MRRMPFRGRPSALFRGTLALLLVCAQLLGAMHAIGHFEAAERPLRVDAQAAPASGGQPATERHERCLLCLAAADLGTALPVTPSLPGPEAPVSALPPDAGTLPAFLRPPTPSSRDPPVSPI